jgi:hypothetical protein
MLHLYSTVLLAVIASNAMAVLLASLSRYMAENATTRLTRFGHVCSLLGPKGNLSSCRHNHFSSSAAFCLVAGLIFRNQRP